MIHAYGIYGIYGSGAPGTPQFLTHLDHGQLHRDHGIQTFSPKFERFPLQNSQETIWNHADCRNPWVLPVTKQWLSGAFPIISHGIYWFPLVSMVWKRKRQPRCCQSRPLFPAPTAERSRSPATEGWAQAGWFKKLWKDPPFYSWVNQRFRLGHFQ